VIDLGTNDGVTDDQRFGIHTQVDEVVDPSTGARLGPLAMRKAIVVARSVYPRFSVASPPPRVERARLNLPGQPIHVEQQLDVKSSEITPLPGAGPVSVGDRVLALEEE
jgi:hypothetical protein